MPHRNCRRTPHTHLHTHTHEAQKIAVINITCADVASLTIYFRSFFPLQHHCFLLHHHHQHRVFRHCFEIVKWNLLLKFHFKFWAGDKLHLAILKIYTFISFWVRFWLVPKSNARGRIEITGFKKRVIELCVVKFSRCWKWLRAWAHTRNRIE